MRPVLKLADGLKESKILMNNQTFMIKGTLKEMNMKKLMDRFQYEVK